MLKKVFAATLAGLFITAPAFANIENYGADKEAYENSGDFRGMKMGGSFFIKGNARQGVDGANKNGYESDLEVVTDFVVSDKTSVRLVVEALDTDWSGNTGVDGGQVNTNDQNYLEVSKATMTHAFETGTTFYGGVAGNGEEWGTAFGEGEDRVYFLQLEQELAMGTLTLKTEKIVDEDFNADFKKDNRDSGANDTDAYLLGLTTKVGGFTIQPAIYYKNVNSVIEDDADDNKKLFDADQEITRLMVAFEGQLGAIGLSGEFGYEDRGDDKVTKATATEKNDESASVYALWVDASTTVASLGLNAGLYYSPADDGAAYLDGGNLCPMEILGDEYSLSGMTLFRVKANKAVTDKISVDASIAYAFTNFDDDYKSGSAKVIKDTPMYFDSGYELDANATFKASDTVTLSAGVAYLDGDYAYTAGNTTKTKAFDEARIDSYAKIHVAF